MSKSYLNRPTVFSVWRYAFDKDRKDGKMMSAVLARAQW